MNTTSGTAYLFQLSREQQHPQSLAYTLASILLAQPTKNEIDLIAQQKHPQIRWLEPEKRTYKKSDFELLVTEVQQQQAVPLIFVITQAELLQESIANSLLKTLEEPPKNIIFVLLTSNELRILPTVRSRLIKQEPIQATNQERIPHPLVVFFTREQLGSQKELQEVLAKNPADDIESAEILDQILLYWHQKETFPDQIEKCNRYNKALLFFINKPPMPGSSRLLWRSLYMSLFIATKNQ